jgi:RHS repeat-associated protein
VKDHRWTNYAGTSDKVKIGHGYDRAGNRLYRQDEASAAQSLYLDELYLYDGVNQLTSARRGRLNSNHDGFESSTENFAQNWTLDATGNWSEFKEGTSQDNWTLDQDREHNEANELTSAGGWATPAHDLAGNMIYAPQPGNLAAGYNLKYDAWNRMVKVTTGSGAGEQTIAEYRYDGDNRRIVKTTYYEGEPVEIRHFYFSKDWQVLEERVGEETVANVQYVWGLRYVDDLVLRDRDTSTPHNGVDERHYALQDANWNVVAIAGYSSGTSQWEVQERYTYAAYGNAEYRAPTSFALRTPKASTLGWTILYTGCNLDPETGLQINRNRYLHLDLGRFIVPDAVYSNPHDGSLYCYVGDAPIDHVDPNGLQRVPCDAVDIASCKKTCQDKADALCKEKSYTKWRVTKDECKYATVTHVVKGNEILEIRTPTCDCDSEGLCSKEVHDKLQVLVNSWCKDAKSGTSCTKAMSADELQLNAMRFEACAKMRETINKKCYGGGDGGHREALAAAMAAARNCRELLKEKAGKK